MIAATWSSTEEFSHPALTPFKKIEALFIKNQGTIDKNKGTIYKYQRALWAISCKFFPSCITVILCSNIVLDVAIRH